MSRFPLLFSPLTVRRTVIRNRILSTGHQTWLAKGNVPSDELIAYHEARARGGVGLIVTEAARYHASSLSESPEIVAMTDACIPPFRRLADAVHAHGARIFGQLSHPGRVTRRSANGMRGVAYAPSAVPDNRFHTVPREMPADMIAEIVAAAGAAAARFRAAGLDGVEVLVSHGLLFAQFLNPAINRRTDSYGGARENRMRALTEALVTIRRSVGDDMIVGIRISAEELEPDGLEADEVIEVVKVLDQAGLVDYVNTTIGSMAGLGGSIHVVPPMEVAHAYVAPRAGAIRSAVRVPVFVAGRINQPQIAEAVLAAGQADMCGMTRALISDPDMPVKAGRGDLDDIRACIGCNQACIGHFHNGTPISCIQNPVTGRELTLSTPAPIRGRKRVLVAGGGPGGMKAAAVAAERGHEVILCEREARLGGQAQLAERLPDRAEFGGLITNLERELQRARVEVRRSTAVNRALVDAIAPDAIIVATGALPYRPELEGSEEAHLADAWAVLKAEANPGSRVVIADWRCDWIGMGLAEKLARDGRHVRLAVNGLHAGQNLPFYLRDLWAGKLHKLGVEVIPYARLFGADRTTAYLVHSVTGEPIVCEEVDTVVLALGHAAETKLEQELADVGLPMHLVGDCLSPRTAEEAIYEGMMAGRTV